MTKNIVICSDGTGNSAAKLHGTNVWRVFNAVNRHHPNKVQITYYDDGVGTDSVRLLRILGGAFGWGLQRNILQAYAFLVINYEPNDKIFLFGFSRGAFTVRSLAGLIGRCGLIDRTILMNARSHRARTAMLHQILNAYRSTKRIGTNKGETIQEKESYIRQELGLSDLNTRSVRIHFVGVWDTVDAVGMPLDEMKEVIGYVWARIFKRRLWHFNDLVPHHCIEYAYQALALDDERRTFHPILWEPKKNPLEGTNHEDPTRHDTQPRASGTCIRQVWFAGMHANVGGGYPRDGLAYVSLNWMIGNAERRGLILCQESKTRFTEEEDVHGHMYNSRTGLRMFYRPALRNPYRRPRQLDVHEKMTSVLRYAATYFFVPRCRRNIDRIPQAPVVHESVVERSERKSNGHAPKILVAGRNVLCTPAPRDGLDADAIRRLEGLDITHGRLHMLFVALLGFLLIWALAFTFQDTFTPFLEAVGDLGALMPDVSHRVEDLGKWWTSLKEELLGGTEDKINNFATSASEGIKKFFPIALPTVVEFLTSNIFEATSVLALLLLIWKAHRLVEVETKLYAFKMWHRIGADDEVHLPLKRIDNFMRKTLLGSLPFLLALLLAAVVFGITFCVVKQIPYIVFGAVAVILFLIAKLGIFER